MSDALIELSLGTVFLGIGLFLLWYAGDWLVRGVVLLADIYHIDRLFLASVIIGIGTSLPEILVALQASWGGKADLAAGNLIGSNITNITLIAGLAAVLGPITFATNGYREFFWMAGVTGLMVVLMGLGRFSSPLGGLFLGMLGVYLWAAYRGAASARRAQRAQNDTPAPPLPASPPEEQTEPASPASFFDPHAHAEKWPILLAVLIGVSLAGLGLGAHVTIQGALKVAVTLGVPDLITGLFLVALGTSLPELAAALAAAKKKEGSLVLGNVVGSNILNLLGGFGAAAAVRPLALAPETLATDRFVLLGTTLLLGLLLARRRRLGRVEGSILLLTYGLFLVNLGRRLAGEGP